ncbi:MAG: maleylpyruvate isomerase family mycothiol-dependent enzyme [Actinobacteria bacterium]|nr:maleylpyruvate isomerase family mycothiol-dependent enzyme [Actinomycetota bacterium]
MTAAAITALEVEVRHARELFVTLTAPEWHAASACEGWRVQDVVQHMASTFQQIVDASSIDTGDSDKVEESAEVPVRARRDWSTDQVLAAYEEWVDKGIAALAALQEPPMAEMVVPISDLGSHPLHLLANAIVFDHYCHLRYDIGAAVDRAAVLPHDEASLDATIEWMLAGIPQMCATQLAAGPQQAVNLVFEGPGGGNFVLAPGDDGWTVSQGSDADAPTVTSGTHEFVSWGTKRSDWRDSTTGDTSNPDVVAVLDAINVI